MNTHIYIYIYIVNIHIYTKKVEERVKCQLLLYLMVAIRLDFYSSFHLYLGGKISTMKIFYAM